jgi:hypothetical protein
MEKYGLLYLSRLLTPTTTYTFNSVRLIYRTTWQKTKTNNILIISIGTVIYYNKLNAHVDGTSWLRNK